VRWRIEQADTFRAKSRTTPTPSGSSWPTPTRRCCATGYFPHPSSPLVIHRFRDPRAGDAYALVLPMVVVGYQVLGDTIVVQAADIIRSQ
jgi:hypothetical protein